MLPLLLAVCFTSHVMSFLSRPWSRPLAELVDSQTSIHDPQPFGDLTGAARLIPGSLCNIPEK